LKVDKDAFLLGMVSRIVEQKGLDILCAALERILKNCQVVIQGLGDEKYQVVLKRLAHKHKNNLSVHLAFNEAMAHKIYAGSDAFLMPSRFEPCGLSQMVSYKYATIPIAHATGGLADTVIDVRRDGGGFALSDYSAADLIVAVHRARDNFEDKKAWSKLIKKVAAYDFCWGSAAEKYITLYRSLIKQG
jgi:starch synthase